MLRHAVLLLYLTVWWPFGAVAQVRQEVTSIRPLLLEAIAKGRSHGIMVGAQAEAASRLFRTQAPVEIDVKALHDMVRTGCKRLQVTTSQKAVWGFDAKTGERDKAPSDQTMTYQISYCADGDFPERTDESESEAE